MRFTRKFQAFRLLAFVSLLTGSALATPNRTVLHNGKIFTADPSHPWAEAIAFEGDRITEVGMDQAVLAHVKPGTQVIDLKKSTAIPGFNDAHVHVVVPEGARINTPAFLPGPGPTLDEIKALISAAAAKAPPGAWLIGSIGTAIFDDPNATRFALDAVSSKNPVVLFAWTGHGTLLNSAGMKALGIAENQPDPFGGHYVRVAGSNKITGFAHEYAEFDIRRRLLALLPDSHLVTQYKNFAQTAVQLGYTTLQDMAVGLTRARTMSTLRAANLPLRIRSICFPITPGESCDIPRPPHGTDGPLLRAMGVKWVTDGTPVERLAFVETPYADVPGFGEPDIEQSPLYRLLEEAKRGEASQEQRLFHSVGDGAINEVLDAMEATGGPRAWHDRRTRIEHGDLLFQPDFKRAKELGVVIVQNATHLALAPVFAQRFQPQVFGELEPLKTLLDRGIPLALGTDGIGSPNSPFIDLMFATLHPTHPSEKLTMAEAVTAYTRGSAYAEFEENEKGMLAPGKLADIAVLSTDVFGASPDFAHGHAFLTFVNGNLVWDSGELGKR